MIIQTGPAFVEYWRGVRHRTRRLLPLVPPERLEWSPGNARWTIGDQFRHLAALERWMWAENVKGRPSRYGGHGPELALGRSAIESYHDRMHDEACAIFGSLTEAELAGKCQTPAGTPITTYKWLRAMVEHEAHHRGQIYFTLGLLDVPVPQLFGLTSEDVLARSVGS
jgi:uncharacterized damage-inducible protein DinB